MSHEEKNIIDIDIYNLDEELRIQPELALHYNSKLADAELSLDEADAKLGLIEAEIASEVRVNPKYFGLDSLSDKKIELAVKTDQRYQDALAEKNRCKHRVAKIKAMTKAVEHRKSSLEGAVKLHGQQYFASPVVKGQRPRNERPELKRVGEE